MKTLQKSSETGLGRSTGQAGDLLGWANYVLGLRGLHANEIDELRDGVLLAELLAQLTGSQPPGRLCRSRPMKRFHALQNLSLLFVALKDHSVKLVNLGPEDILNGNVKLIQGLLWALVQTFVIGESESESAEDLGAVKGTPKQRLLQWVQLLVNAYPGVDIKSFRSGWNDGLALAALVNFHCPGAIDFDKLPATGVGALVLEVLERRWGITGLVDAETLANGADEQSMCTMVALLRRELVREPREEEEEKPDGGEKDRQLLAAVMQSARQGDRRATDEALAAVVGRVRSEASLKALPVPRRTMELPLRNLLADAISLCQKPESALSYRLVRRDLGLLRAALRQESGVESSRRPLLSEGREKGLSVLEKELELAATPASRRALEREKKLVAHVQASAVLLRAAETGDQKMAEDGLQMLRTDLKHARTGEAGDELDEALGSGDSLSWRAAARAAAVAAAREEKRDENGPARLVAGDLLAAALRLDVAEVSRSGDTLRGEASRAISRAEKNRKTCVDKLRVDSFIRDVLLLTPAHEEAVKKSQASNDGDERLREMQNVRKVTRDLVQLVEDLSLASRGGNDEFEDLQSLACQLDPLSLSQEFDFIVASRELAHENKESSLAVDGNKENLRREVPRLLLANLAREESDAERRREGLA